MITELQAQRLHLRQMKESDSLSMLKIWSNRDVTQFMNISNFTDKNQVKDMIHFL
ncbi:GNAT family N-acetyltransferase, partial [Bacillus wiedmannii]